MMQEQIPSFPGLTGESRNYAIERQLNRNHVIVFMPMCTLSPPFTMSLCFDIQAGASIRQFEHPIGIHRFDFLKG